MYTTRIRFRPSLLALIALVFCLTIPAALADTTQQVNPGQPYTGPGGMTVTNDGSTPITITIHSTPPPVVTVHLDENNQEVTVDTKGQPVAIVLSANNCTANVTGGNATITYTGTSTHPCTGNTVNINGGNGNRVNYTGYSTTNTTNIQGGSSNNVVVYQNGNANNNTTNIGQLGTGSPSNGNTIVHTTSQSTGRPTGNTTNVNNGSNNQSLNTKSNSTNVAKNAGQNNGVN